MTIVLDASAVIGVVLIMPDSIRHAKILEEADLVVAPDLFVAEVCNTMWKYRRANLLSSRECESALEHALGLADRLESSQDLYREAFALAERHDHPVYDTLYLVLARRNNALLLTRDRRLAELARKLEIALSIPGAS